MPFPALPSSSPSPPARLPQRSPPHRMPTPGPGRITNVASTPSTPAASSGGGSTAGVADLSYERARDELIRVVNELEQGSSTLEQSLALWERGEALARRCEEWLIGAKARLDAARSAAAPRSDALPDSAS